MRHRRHRPHRPAPSGPRPRPSVRVAVLVAALVVAACAVPAEDEPAPTDRLLEGGADPEIDEEEEAERYDDPTRRGHDPDAPDDPDDDAVDEPTPALDSATSEHGEHLVDGQGRTLYVSALDPPGESTCTGTCLQEWPILSTIDAPEVAGDVDEDLVGTIVRGDTAGDDLEQVTYRDKPLHYHRLDQLPGQVTAQGQDDTWFLIGPDGVELRGGATDG